MKEKAIEDKDNIQFRVLYFIGILLIVGAHGGGGAIPLFAEWFPAYSFHLALFVFCSGYFFVNKKDKPVKLLIKRLFTRFLIPLYMWNLFYGILIIILHKFGIQFGLDFSFKSLLILPIYNGEQFVFNLSSWFVWPLVIIQFINIFCIKILKTKTYYYYIYFIVALCFGFAGVQLAINGYNKEWFLIFDKVLYFFPFFALGILYKTKLEEKDRLGNLTYFGICFLVALILLHIRGYHYGYGIAYCDNFDNFYRPFIVGIIGIAFWLRVSRILAPALKDSKLVKIISKNTFSIMMHHLTGFFIFSSLCLLFFRITKIPNNFDIVSYKSSIYYLYLPYGHAQFTLLYGIAGYSFSLFMLFITKKIKIILKKITHFTT